MRGFERAFAHDGLAVPPEAIAGLDVGSLWLIHAGRQALAAAGYAPADRRLARAGAILGNLAYPSRGLAAFAEGYWTGTNVGAARDRFNSGLPADNVCSALGLGGFGYCLDAACASSLYAIALAADALDEGRADLMLAGAVSPTGQSRPFHKDANGLIPAEGAAVVALKRLEQGAGGQRAGPGGHPWRWPFQRRARWRLAVANGGWRGLSAATRL